MNAVTELIRGLHRYSNRSAIELIRDRYYVELQEEHSDLFV